MTNNYYTHSSSQTAHTLARAESINAQLEGVEAGFDKLPSPEVLREGRFNFGTDSGSANAYVVTLPTAPTAYTVGMEVWFKPSAANTGPCTINLGLGTKSLTAFDGSALVAGDLPAGCVAGVRYDGTNFRLVSTHGGHVTSASTSATAAAASATSAASSAAAAASSAAAAATFDPASVAITGGTITGVTAINGGPLGEWRNKVINGDFSVAQRGSGPFTAAGYTLDRWLLTVATDGGTSTLSVSQQSFTPSQNDVAGFPRHYVQVRGYVSGGAGNDFVSFQQRIEGVQTLSGRTAVLSFWAKASVGTPTLGLYFTQNFGSGGSSTLYRGQTTITLSTVWQRFIVVVSLPSVAGKSVGAGDYLGLVFFTQVGTTFNSTYGTGFSGTTSWASAATFSLAEVSLTPGSGVMDFPRRAPGEEIRLCQRYYWSLSAGNRIYMSPRVNDGVSVARHAFVKLPVTMRATPTFSITTYTGTPAVSYSSDNDINVYADASSASAQNYISAMTASAEI